MITDNYRTIGVPDGSAPLPSPNKSNEPHCSLSAKCIVVGVVTRNTLLSSMFAPLAMDCYFLWSLSASEYNRQCNSLFCNLNKQGFRCTHFDIHASFCDAFFHRNIFYSPNQFGLSVSCCFGWNTLSWLLPLGMLFGKLFKMETIDSSTAVFTLSIDCCWQSWHWSIPLVPETENLVSQRDATGDRSPVANAKHDKIGKLICTALKVVVFLLDTSRLHICAKYVHSRHKTTNSANLFLCKHCNWMSLP